MQRINNTEITIILSLLLLSAVPAIGGLVRLVDIGLGLDILPVNPRIHVIPTPAVLHIISSTIFCILGACQFIRSIKINFPLFHTLSGRVVVVSGACSALTGVWLTSFYHFPTSLQGDLLFNVRLIVGFSMVFFILLGLFSILMNKVKTHQAWMIRAYALGQGAGTQVLVSIPWLIVANEPEGLMRDILMTSSWIINLVVAESIIYHINKAGKL